MTRAAIASVPSVEREEDSSVDWGEVDPDWQPEDDWYDDDDLAQWKNEDDEIWSRRNIGVFPHQFYNSISAEEKERFWNDVRPAQELLDMMAGAQSNFDRAVRVKQKRPELYEKACRQLSDTRNTLGKVDPYFLPIAAYNPYKNQASASTWVEATWELVRACLSTEIEDKTKYEELYNHMVRLGKFASFDPKRAKEYGTLDDMVIPEVGEFVAGWDAEICKICDDEMEEAIELPCGCIFHEQCIMPWLEEKSVCPDCGAEIDFR